MNKLLSLLLLSISLIAPQAVVANESMESATEKCQAWAVEEKVTSDELKEYISECVKSLMEDETKKDG